MKRDSSSIASSPFNSEERLEPEEDDFDFDEPPFKKSKAGGSRKKGDRVKTERELLIEARKIRNREAAQASRDRKKLNSERLEKRVLELENLLTANSTTSTLPILPLHSNTSPAILLENENTLLRTQLKLEQMQSANLQLRLSSLEDQFTRLEKALAGGVTREEGTMIKTTDYIEEQLVCQSSSTFPLNTQFSTADSQSNLILNTTSSLNFPTDVSTTFPDTTTTTSSIIPYQLDDLTFNEIWGEWANGLENKKEEANQGEEFDWSSALFSFDQQVQLEDQITC